MPPKSAQIQTSSTSWTSIGAGGVWLAGLLPNLCYRYRHRQKHVYVYIPHTRLLSLLYFRFRVFQNQGALFYKSLQQGHSILGSFLAPSVFWKLPFKLLNSNLVGSFQESRAPRHRRNEKCWLPESKHRRAFAIQDQPERWLRQTLRQLPAEPEACPDHQGIPPDSAVAKVRSTEALLGQ